MGWQKLCDLDVSGLSPGSLPWLLTLLIADLGSGYGWRMFDWWQVRAYRQALRRGISHG